VPKVAAPAFPPLPPGLPMPTNAVFPMEMKSSAITSPATVVSDVDPPVISDFSVRQSTIADFPNEIAHGPGTVLKHVNITDSIDGLIAKDVFEVPYVAIKG